MKRPRSDAVMRRFMRGESVDDIAAEMCRKPTCFWDIREAATRVEAALRRAMLKSEKRRRRSR